jgi:hypothetical protein
VSIGRSPHVIYGDRRGSVFNTDCVRRPNQTHYQFSFYWKYTSPLSIFLDGIRMPIATAEDKKSWPQPNYENPDNLRGLIVGVIVPALALAVVCKCTKCQIEVVVADRSPWSRRSLYTFDTMHITSDRRARCQQSSVHQRWIDLDHC